jgi:hypothetical protein
MFKKAEGRRSPTPQSPPQPPSIAT